MSVGLNFDAAAAQDIEFSQELIDAADFVLKDGQTSEGVTPELPEVGAELPDIPLDERRAADLAFLAERHCTDEIIAEQQAALDAADE